MLKWIIKTGLKFVSYETLVQVIAQGMAYILEYARNNASEDGWKMAKSANKSIKNWSTLLDEVYDDDKLTEEEEKKIQDAIAECTATKSIYNLIQGKKTAKKTSRKTSKQIEG